MPSAVRWAADRAKRALPRPTDIAQQHTCQGREVRPVTLLRGRPSLGPVARLGLERTRRRAVGAGKRLKCLCIGHVAR